ncbi:hypothetical protein [Mycolicibacterium fortuitum]|uniref:hypothetical protein n=1 Tax=Mycolicibacterium fortuitum TaxID=1766 RepID=UPI00096C70B9|nr:hypothetical protein [Mycolicibacterium fortuitum]OMC05875.1 hypothetical protein A5734_06710 [Mycolicibacterium fortuitum]
MTMFCDDFVLLAGMHDASTASLSCARTGATKGIARQSVERAGRKRKPEEQSHKSLNLPVVAGRNAA